MAWGKMGSVTATGSTAGQTLSSLSDNKFIQIMAHQIPNASGNVNSLLTFNGDVGSNQYQNRYNDNGASDGTFQYTSMVIASADSVFNRFEVIYVLNIAGEEKLMIGTAVNGEGANATSPPIRTERASKWINTADPISSIKIAPASNNYVADTNISVLGSDLTPAAAVPFPTNVQVGSRAEITDTRKMYHYTYDWFLEGTTIPPQPSTRGLFAGGEVSTDTVDYITIATAGNATDFGNLTLGRHNMSAVSSGTRAVFIAGTTGTYTDTMDYVTVATTGNATDFGDTLSAIQSGAGVSSETRGVTGGGNTSGGVSNVIQYITIDTLGNGTDFGNLTSSRHSPSGVSSGTRGVWGGGFTSGNVNTIDYVTIATTGDATTFGNLTASRRAGAGCGSTTRGLFGGGYEGGHVNKIDYITIATTGNAVDFGDLTRSNNVLGACSSNTRGVWGGGNNTNVNTIDYVTIDATGNATDFGDLTAGRAGVVGTDGY